MPAPGAGRPAPAAAWAGRRSGHDAAHRLEPASGPLVAVNVLRGYPLIEIRSPREVIDDEEA